MCKFAEVRCDIPPCNGKIFKKYDIEKHFTDECPGNQIKCEFCNA